VVPALRLLFEDHIFRCPRRVSHVNYWEAHELHVGCTWGTIIIILLWPWGRCKNPEF
jgi:hypothetical protein